jgi:hypothetical protein
VTAPVMSVIGSTYQIPCIEMPRIDIQRLGSTCCFHISICHIFHCHVTHITTRDRTVTPRIQLPSLITASMQYLSSQFKYSRVTFQITLDESLIDRSLYSLLEDLVFLPFYLPIVPLHLVESKPPLPLAYINPAIPRTHDICEMEAAFFSQTTPTSNKVRPRKIQNSCNSYL